MLVGIQIKIMSTIYSKIMNWFNDWENHETQSAFDSYLTVKLIMFDFVNNYSSLFYIAFIKVKLTLIYNRYIKKVVPIITVRKSLIKQLIQF